MDETAPIPVLQPKANPQVTVEFEKEDCSIGTARYTDAKPVSKNLSMKPGPEGSLQPMPHANVRVRLQDDKGNEVPMTRRLVRTWDIQPLKGATVRDLSKWHIVGLQSSEFSPFSPFQLSPNERPGDTTFKLDHPNACDAPGLQFIKRDPFGILQEFLAGNESAGGAYFQTITLFDRAEIRIMNTRSMTLTAAEYRALLKRIDTGDYTKAMIRKLYFMPSGVTDDITAVPQEEKKK
jgi:hypothetical protein